MGLTTSDPYDDDAACMVRLKEENRRLTTIVSVHSKLMNPDGSTSGYCSECDWIWPCPTYHIAKGWDHHECENDKWCAHEEVPYR